MRFILLLFIPVTLFTYPIFNYHQHDATTIQLRYSNLDIGDFVDGDSIDDLMITFGFNFDGWNYAVAVSKSINRNENSENSENSDDLEYYHCYNAIGWEIDISKHINILLRYTFDLNTDQITNNTTDIGFGGILYEVKKGHPVTYQLLYTTVLGQIEDLGIQKHLLNITLHIPLHYINLGFTLQHNLKDNQQYYMLSLSVDELIKKRF